MDAVNCATKASVDSVKRPPQDWFLLEFGGVLNEVTSNDLMWEYFKQTVPKHLKKLRYIMASCKNQ